MSKNQNLVRQFADLINGVWTAPIGSALPSATAAPVPGVWPTGWSEVGWLTDGTITDIENYNETNKYGQAGVLVSVLRNQAVKQYQIEAMETNATTAGLLRPNAAVATTGETDEVQTVTISGTPTGGTIPLTLPGYGTYSAVYNVPTATLQTALRSAFGIPGLTVTGTAGTSYVVTFVGAGDVPTMQTNGGSLTGGSSPNAAVAVTTPGANGVNSFNLLPNTSRNLRYFGLDVVSGGIYRKLVLTNTEAIRNGNVAYTSTDDTVYPMTLNCYIDSQSRWGYEVNNDPNLASGLFT